MCVSRWFRIGEDSEALAGLPWIAQARLYGGAVLGMPRQLLSLAAPTSSKTLPEATPTS
jgi:hypothetical protein